MNDPQPGDPAYRCAGASVLRDEPLAGTASTVRAYLLVEETGPWGVDALRDARLPEGLGVRLGAAAAAAGVRALLVRRPDRSEADGRRVLAAYADPVAPWLETGTVDDLHELLDLDLAGLRRGGSLGWARDDASVYCVCTHGKHDACCAERGRPAAAALEALRPEQTWEVSHIGGDRFAGNMLVLPHGLYYGRVDARSALEIAGAHEAGELVLDHLRGRSGLSMPAQAAEVALRRELRATRDDAVRFVGARREGDLTLATFEVVGGRWAVRVRTRDGAPSRLTCGSSRDNPVPEHEVLEVTGR